MNDCMIGIVPVNAMFVLPVRFSSFFCLSFAPPGPFPFHTILFAQQNNFIWYSWYSHPQLCWFVFPSLSLSLSFCLFSLHIFYIHFLIALPPAVFSITFFIQLNQMQYAFGPRTHYWTIINRIFHFVSLFYVSDFSISFLSCQCQSTNHSIKLGFIFLKAIFVTECNMD